VLFRSVLYLKMIRLCVIAILITDLLQGIAIGMTCGFFFVLKANYHAAITLTQHGSHYLLRLHKDVSFLNKALLRKLLNAVPDNSNLLIDGHKAHFIDSDILESLIDFIRSANARNIIIELEGFRNIQLQRLADEIAISQ
jgi:MFS superfamily sulfate permease-like transporter